MPDKKNAALVAFLEHPTVAAASEASGIGQATMFRYLQDKVFRVKYQDAKNSLVDAALRRLQQACGNAVEVLVEIMKNKNIALGVHVRAADSKL